MVSAERLIEVFDQAKTRPAGAERDQYLSGACRNETELKEQVLSLLQAHEGAGDFLKSPQYPVAVVLTEKPGDWIDRYKLLQKIGEGGCGIVYMAEQEEPVRRRVALKIIKFGMDTRSVVARFEAERQALALMDHPNIAKVFDAGATDTGRPYFVMELVRGTKITDYCDQNGLSTEERLNLFAKVCYAIQHAHQKGVIHRDIKPSNILVTVNEPGSPGNPKVIDFGIAKATTGERLTDKTVFTAFEQFIGTPAYMSPEQAVMTTLDIDTRTDIYALGVLLYELLTGKTPFDANDLMASGLDAMRQTIREKEPACPSTRVSTMSEIDVETIVRHRRSDAPKLIYQLQGDLDWIVMKALEKDRARRYETASSLATDIQRHLNDEPVVARPQSNLYRFQKLIRRNKLAFGSITGVSLALVLGLCLASWGLVRERAARREAESARNLARTESAKNEEVAKFLMTTIGPGAWGQQEANLVRPILLDFFSARLGTNLTNQPEAQGDLWLSMANGCAAVGDYTRAVTNCHRAVNAYRLAFGENDAKVALAFSRLSNYQRLGKDFSGARKNGQQSVAIARKTGNAELLAICLLDAGKAFNESGETSEAIPLLRETILLRRKVVGNFLALGDSTQHLVRALRALAATGKQDEAKAILQDELKKAPTDGVLQKLYRDLNNEHNSASRDITQPGDLIFASSRNSLGSEGVANAIDNNEATKYLNWDSGRDGNQIGTFSPSGFAVQPAVGSTVVTGMGIQSANDAPDRDPDVVVLEGSNDTNLTSYASGVWTPITTISNIAVGFIAPFQSQEFSFSNSTPYRNYRWRVEATRSTPNGCCMQVAEVWLTTTAPTNGTSR
jgi:serine/threonine protein kinase